MKAPISHSKNRLAVRRAFTLIELLVVIATLAILAVMLLPALAGTQVQSKTTACTARYRQWSASANLYANDHQGWLPTANPSGGGAYAWDVGTALSGMMFPYGMDVPVWFCPMRPSAFDNANTWAQANLGHPIQIITNLVAYWSHSYAGECVINDNYWVPRWNGSGPIPAGATLFPIDYSTHPKAIWPAWLSNEPTPTFAIYGWPRRLHDIAVPYVPFVSDSAGSGNGGGLVPPGAGVGLSGTNISPNTAHFVNGKLIGVNLAFADGHVAGHTPNQMLCVYSTGSTFWFY
jgi:prepilin-type N-terminal cleavage/methylation domain-containing protein/prepilin-type processing-associated H-X9-DG protein